MGTDSKWKCTIDEDYEVGKKPEVVNDNAKALKPDCEITDWKEIGPLTQLATEKFRELELLATSFSYEGDMSIEKIRKMDEIATWLYTDASKREGIYRFLKDRPFYEYDPAIYGKDNQTYHFLAIKSSTDMMLNRARELAAILQIPPHLFEKYTEDRAIVWVDDEPLLHFPVDSFGDIVADINSCARECIMRIELIKKLIQSI